MDPDLLQDQAMHIRVIQNQVVTVIAHIALLQVLQQHITEIHLVYPINLHIINLHTDPEQLNEQINQEGGFCLPDCTFLIDDCPY